ncbi:MAG: Hsp20/alpha crystallin family protein [Patescibacteria group bacterium]|nr:Hsp20/alpha crystallin family protein [Patescibacteria group bacterium]
MKIRTITPLARWMSRSPWELFEDMDWPQVTWNSGLDVYEEGDSVHVKAAVPGIPADKVEVTYEDGVLRINARHEESEEEKKRKTVVYRADRVSSFDYSTTFPRPIDAASIQATVRDGIVTVTAKIAEEAKAKKIAVKAA